MRMTEASLSYLLVHAEVVKQLLHLLDYGTERALIFLAARIAHVPMTTERQRATRWSLPGPNAKPQTAQNRNYFLDRDNSLD